MVAIKRGSVSVVGLVGEEARVLEYTAHEVIKSLGLNLGPVNLVVVRSVHELPSMIRDHVEGLGMDALHRGRYRAYSIVMCDGSLTLVMLSSLVRRLLVDTEALKTLIAVEVLHSCRYQLGFPRDIEGLKPNLEVASSIASFDESFWDLLFTVWEIPLDLFIAYHLMKKGFSKGYAKLIRLLHAESPTSRVPRRVGLGEVMADLLSTLTLWAPYHMACLPVPSEVRRILDHLLAMYPESLLSAYRRLAPTFMKAALAPSKDSFKAAVVQAVLEYLRVAKALGLLRPSEGKA